MFHIILVSAVLLMIPIRNNKNLSKILRSIAFWILFLFLALRYDFGNDYQSYHLIHSSFNAGLMTWGYDDVLFRNLNLWISNFYFFIAIISLFYIIVIKFLIKCNLNVNLYWFSIFLLLINPYLFLMHLSALRQTLAICFFILAIHFAIKKKIWMYLFFIVIAIGFHGTAIILLPTYFVLNESKVNKGWRIGLIIGLIVMLISPFFLNVISELLIHFPSHFTSYFEQGLQNSLRATLLSSAYFFFVFMNINKLQGSEIVYGKLYLIATIILVLGFNLSMISRIGMYFDIFAIIAIPQILSRIQNKLEKKIWIFILIFIYILRYYSFFMNPMWESFIHYRTIFGR